jgi:hypothetical protein
LYQLLALHGYTFVRHLPLVATQPLIVMPMKEEGRGIMGLSMSLLLHVCSKCMIGLWADYVITATTE